MFQITFFLDTYNFRECSAYSGDGITFNFLVQRDEYESFVGRLEAEREAIIGLYGDTSEG